MSYRSYCILGNNCRMQTVALTDNTKFISPCNSVYSKKCTIMYKYPGHDNPIINQIQDSDHHHPEHIKAMFHEENETRNKLVSCKSCGTH